MNANSWYQFWPLTNSLPFIDSSRALTDFLKSPGSRRKLAARNVSLQMKWPRRIWGCIQREYHLISMLLIYSNWFRPCSKIKPMNYGHMLNCFQLISGCSLEMLIFAPELLPLRFFIVVAKFMSILVLFSHDIVVTEFLDFVQFILIHSECVLWMWYMRIDAAVLFCCWIDRFDFIAFDYPESYRTNVWLMPICNLKHIQWPQSISGGCVCVLCAMHISRFLVSFHPNVVYLFLVLLPPFCAQCIRTYT